MNTYLKTVMIAGLAVAASAAIAARPAEPVAEPLVLVLPSPVVTALLQYLGNRPYADVIGLISGLQRCIQDQVPDSKGAVAPRGGCPEITEALSRLAAPVRPVSGPPK